MRIAIDIDAVLADFLSEFLRFRNQRFRTRWKRRDFWSYNWSVVFAEESKVLNAVLFDFFNSHEIRSIRPMPGAKWGIRKLKKRGHDLAIITSRPRFIAEITGEWLDRYYGDAFEMVYFSNNPDWQSFGMTKGEIASSWKADLFIDDQMGYCKEAASRGIATLLYDNPWNMKDELPENVYRVITWGDVLGVVKELEQAGI